MHDIGYVFQGRSGSEIRAVDRMFRPSSIAKHSNRHLRSRAAKAAKNYDSSNFERINNPEEMITALRFLPWGSEARMETDVFETFDKYRVASGYNLDDLEDFAYQVAAAGYDGISTGTVDHAVASGLFLLRYSSFWYYIAKELNFEDDFQVYQNDYPHTEIFTPVLMSHRTT